MRPFVSDAILQFRGGERMSCPRLILLAALLAPALGVAAAGAACLEPLQGPLREVQGEIRSLRTDAALPSRMIAPDGSIYESLRVAWMLDQLSLIDDACRRGREVEATWRVEALQRELEAGALPAGKAPPAPHRPGGLLATSSK
jgi:hypothetical protein